MANLFFSPNAGGYKPPTDGHESFFDWHGTSDFWFYTPAAERTLNGTLQVTDGNGSIVFENYNPTIEGDSESVTETNVHQFGTLPDGTYSVSIHISTGVANAGQRRSINCGVSIRIYFDSNQHLETGDYAPSAFLTIPNIEPAVPNSSCTVTVNKIS